MHSDREHAQSLAEKPPKQLRPTLEALLDWLVQSAYPLWARLGYDSFYGGYHELLGRDGPIEREPRRARVQVRQIYAFARAASFGWTGDAPALVAQGWAYFFKHYLRPDGLFRTLVAFDGSLLDGQAFLYDQAFVLLALAETERAFGPNSAHGIPPFSRTV